MKKKSKPAKTASSVKVKDLDAKKNPTGGLKFDTDVVDYRGKKARN